MFKVNVSNHYCSEINPDSFLKKVNSSVVNLLYRNNEVFQILIKTLSNNLSSELSSSCFKVLREELEYCCLNIPNFEIKFMLCEQITTFIRKQDYLANIGRGSSASSLICYGLGITNINPIKYNLDWRRFLTTGFEIDIDIPGEVRDDLNKYLKQTYPDNFYFLGSIQNFRMKTAATEVLNKIGWSFSAVAVVTKELDQQCKELGYESTQLSDPMSFVEVYQRSQILQLVFKQQEQLVDEIKKTMSLIKNYGVHPSAYLFTEKKLSKEELISVHNRETDSIAHPDQRDNSENIVINILGLGVLSDVNKILKEKKMNIEVLKYLNLQDKRVFSKINQIQNSVSPAKYFQTKWIEGFKDFNFNELEDLAIFIAVHRPGVTYNYANPGIKLNRFDSIVARTNGHIVFQEQIISILTKIGINDLLCFKKLMQGSDLYKEQLLEKLSLEEYEEIKKYAKSSFNRSHATAYSVYSYLDVFFHEVL